jgi:hypothetical protein
VYLLWFKEAFSVTASFSVLYMYTEPDTFVKQELRPPVIRMLPSAKPIATEYDYKHRLDGTSFLLQTSPAKSYCKIRF